MFLTYLENYSLDVEVIIEAELSELNHFCIIYFKGSKEGQMIGLHECRTLIMKFVIIGNTMTSFEKTVYGNIFVVI